MKPTTNVIKKINNAIKSNQDSIVLWGDGTPTRDFLFVDDAAEGIVLAAEKYEKTEPLNLGSGEEISIHDLAQLIMKIMGVNLKIKWDTTKPNGQPRRCISSERAKNEIGFVAETSLELGLKQTIEWYLK